jgi:uncharacterized membrane protein
MDVLIALFALGLVVLLFISPVVYGLWRGRDAPMLTNVPRSSRRVSAIVGVAGGVVAVGLSLVVVSSHETSRRAAVVTVAAGLSVIVLALLLVWLARWRHKNSSR